MNNPDQQNAGGPDFRPFSVKRCAVYARASDQDHEKEYGSCDAQADFCSSFAERYKKDGWVIVEIIKDPDEKSVDLQRPGLRRLLELVRKGEIDVIIVYRRDRLFRDLGHASQLQAYFDVHGVIVASTIEGIYDRSPHSKFARNIIDAVSELERLVTITRVRDSVRSAAARGDWTAGNAPFGYTHIPGTKSLSVNEAEAAIVRYVFTSIANGVTLREVVRSLRDKKAFGRLGYRNTRDGQRITWQAIFTAYTIRKMVTNIAYRGCVRARSPEDVDGGTAVKKPSKWAVFKGRHIPLVEDDVWFRANRMLGVPDSDRSRRKDRPADVRLSFMAGIACCGDCHCALTPVSARKRRRDGKMHRYLRCTRHLRAAELSTCRTKCVSADAVEGAFLSFVNGMASGGEEMARLECQNRSRRLEEQVRKWKSELIALQERCRSKEESVARLMDFVATSGSANLTPEFLQAAEAAKNERVTLAHEIARIENNILRAGARTPDPSQVQAAFRRFAILMGGADMKPRHELVNRVIHSATVARVATAFGDGEAPSRVYRLGLRVNTNSLLELIQTDTDPALGHVNYANLDFGLTFEIKSNAKQQVVSVLETNVSLARLAPQPKG